MHRVAQRILRFLREEDGPTAVEYAFLLMLILLVALTAIVTFGEATNACFEHSRDEMAQVMP